MDDLLEAVWGAIVDMVINLIINLIIAILSYLLVEVLYIGFDWLATLTRYMHTNLRGMLLTLRTTRPLTLANLFLLNE